MKTRKLLHNIMKKQKIVCLCLGTSLLLTGCPTNLEGIPSLIQPTSPTPTSFEENALPVPTTEAPVFVQNSAAVEWTYKVPEDPLGKYMALVTYDNDQNGLENFIHIPLLISQTAVTEEVNQRFQKMINDFGDTIYDYNSDCISTYAGLDKDGILHIVIIEYQSYGYGSSGLFSSVNYDTIHDAVISVQDILEHYYSSDDDFWNDFYIAFEDQHTEITRYNLHGASIVGFYKNQQGNPIIIVSATKIVENAGDWYSTFMFDVVEKSVYEASCHTFSDLAEYR